MEMARHLPVSTLAGQLDETDTRLWRFISHYVDEARGLEDHTGVCISSSRCFVLGLVPFCWTRR